MLRISQIHDDVPASIDEYLNHFGRKNPSAWINPYTAQPMAQVDFANCQYGPEDTWKNPDFPVPKEMISDKSDKSLYAGNYSFAVIDGKNGKEAIFAIYYLDKNDNLSALTCTGVSKSQFLNQLKGSD